ncbi:MAG: hypothetical protein V3R57_04385, partial [Candidatus Bathyarchaeia archaeon]
MKSKFRLAFVGVHQPHGWLYRESIRECRSSVNSINNALRAVKVVDAIYEFSQSGKKDGDNLRQCYLRSKCRGFDKL